MAEEDAPENAPNEKPSPRKPHRISKPGWKGALVRIKDNISKHHLSIIAAGVAFYVMLGIFPGIAAGISIYGLVADPEDIEEHFAQMDDVMPEEAQELLLEQMSRISDQQAAAGLGAFLGIAFALWSGSRGTKATMEALNITYEEGESRGTIKLYLTGLALTLALVMLGLLAVAVIVVLPPLLNALPDPVAPVVSILRWPLLLFIGILGVTLMYRFGPSRRQPHWKWLTWGSAAATLAWLAISALFSLFVANFGNYDETYGSLGGIIVLLMWLYLSAYVVLIGAELDAAMGRQTEKEALPE